MNRNLGDVLLKPTNRDNILDFEDSQDSIDVFEEGDVLEDSSNTQIYGELVTSLGSADDATHNLQV